MQQHDTNTVVADGLISWNDGAARKSIAEFVSRVTQKGSPDFVPPQERIAVFDNDGTLWVEQPMYVQAFFVLDRIRELAPQHPEWKEREPFASVLKGDMNSALSGGEPAIVELVMATHAGMTTEEFEKIVAAWITTARHPATSRLYTGMVYQPMLELLAYLRASSFMTFIVSAGGIEFMRPWTERIYSIPPQHIGRRPIAAFGNSHGDFEMLDWVTSGAGPRFGLLVHHDDDAREFAYDRASAAGKLDRGLDEAPGRGWTLVSMKRDWKRVFAFEND